MDGIYASLPLTTPTSIRVLELFPAKFREDPIRIRLRVTDIDESNDNGCRHEPYEALSYTWGSPESPLPITVLAPKDCGDEDSLGNNHRKRSEEHDSGTNEETSVQMDVTRNLHSALTRLRQQNKTRIFWIDAISMNQSDYEERAAQVKIMKRVYQKAKGVTADLGEWNSKSLDNLMRLINSMGNLVVERHEKDDDEIWTAEMYERLGLPNWEDDAWIEWENFLSRPYFVRVWTIQEFAAANNLTVLIDTMIWPSNFICVLIQFMERHVITEDVRRRPSSKFDPARVNAAIRGRLGIKNMQTLRESWHIFHTPRCIMANLSAARFSTASDPKDHIFALLGLVTDVDLRARGMEISYDPDERVAEVYERVSRSIIQQDPKRLLSILYEAGAAVKVRIENLPSWVPDWSSRRAGSPLGDLATDIYHAANAMDLEFEFAPYLQPMNQSQSQNAKELLILKASFVDSIHGRTCSYDDPRPDDETYIAIPNSKTWIEAAHHVRKTLLPSDDGRYLFPPDTTETHYEAFWRTLIGNKTYFDSPAPASYATCYETFMKYQGTIDFGQETGKGSLKDEVSTKPTKESEAEAQASNLYRYALQNMMFTRSFVVTYHGLMGMVPGESDNNDEIVLIAGSAVPFVVRRIDDGSDDSIVKDDSTEGSDQCDTSKQEAKMKKYKLIGECYVHGLMESSAGRLANLKWEKLALV